MSPMTAAPSVLHLLTSGDLVKFHPTKPNSPLLARFGSGLRLRWELQHTGSLACTQHRQQHGAPTGNSSAS